MDRPRIDDQITFIYTTDLRRSAEFYEQTLDLPLILDQGRCRIYAVAGNAYLGVCERPAGDLALPPRGKRSVILTLVTEEVERWYERLQAAGVELPAEPRFNAEYGITHFFLHDPSGYLLEIQRFEGPWRGRPAG